MGFELQFILTLQKIKKVFWSVKVNYIFSTLEFDCITVSFFCFLKTLEILRFFILIKIKCLYTEK